MNFIETILSENTGRDFLIALIIFGISLFIAKRIYEFLRVALPRWLSRITIELDQDQISPAAAAISLLMVIAGLNIAKIQLQFPKQWDTWANLTLLVLGEIFFLLVLIQVFKWIVEAASKRYLEGIGQEEPARLKDLKETLYHRISHINRLSMVILVLVPLLTILFSIGVIPLAVWFLPVVLLFIMGILYARLPSQAHQRQRTSSVHKVADGRVAPQEEYFGPGEPVDEVRESVIDFFLNIYRRQLGASEQAPTKFSGIDTTSSSRNSIYELSVKVDQEWTSRRMTIGPLGEEAGSRSKCFYVIYDVHLVIKIPPHPIVDFDEYLRMIRKEARIVEKLDMKESIVPTISVILNMIYPFPDEKNAGPADLEERYIKRMGNSSELQQYLKIGDTFVFFMDLSKYYFLQNIMEMLHESQEKMQKEIRGHSLVMSDPAALERMYGQENLLTFLNIKKIFATFEIGARKLLQGTAVDFSSFQHQIKNWFFNRLAGKEIAAVEEGLNTEIVDDLNDLLDRAIMNNPDAIGAYIEILKKSLKRVMFIQNKSQIEGIIVNLLKLLVKLRQRCVAMRDLKPDNLLVAGDRSTYPKFLSHPEQYTIGLIDVETAVLLEQSTGKNMDQPLLGGTPHYATPSHFLENDTLASTFEDLPGIFYLQDWHAVIVIIYKLITGEYLFEETSVILPEVIRILETSPSEAGQRNAIVGHVSKLFWSKAAAEFKAKLAQNVEVLNAVNIYLPDVVKRMIGEYIEKEKEDMAVRIREKVNAQNIFGSEKNRKLLISCSVQEIGKLKKKLEKANGIPEVVITNKGKILDFLQNIGTLKIKSEQLDRKAALLRKEETAMSGHALLNILFGVVFYQMYEKLWS